MRQAGKSLHGGMSWVGEHQQCVPHKCVRTISSSFEGKATQQKNSLLMMMIPQKYRVSRWYFPLQIHSQLSLFKKDPKLNTPGHTEEFPKLYFLSYVSHQYKAICRECCCVFRFCLHLIGQCENKTLYYRSLWLIQEVFLKFLFVMRNNKTQRRPIHSCLSIRVFGKLSKKC